MAGMEIAQLFAKVGADVSDFSRGMDQVKRDLGDAESGFGRVSSLIGGGLKLAAGAGVAAVGALASGIGYATKQAADMEQGIANIAASMQLGSEETDQLKKHIMDLGMDPKLKVTATEAAQAIEVLGTAGLTLDEILQGAARSTVLLANSTGADFGQAGAIASDVMAQFNIEAADMAAAVDQITGVTVASKFDINDYALALAQAGGVAGSVGVEFEDFNAAIAAISPNFASGSDAGTSFKTFLQTLIPKSSDAEDSMRALGLITLDVEEAAAGLSEMLGYKIQPTMEAVQAAAGDYAYQLGLGEAGSEKLAKETQKLLNRFRKNAFFDKTTGELKDMADIAGILQEAFAGLSDQERIDQASTIFGTDAMRAAFGLIDAGTEGIEEMKRLIGDTSAEESAATRMDTLTGAWEIFQGVLDTLVLSIGDEFLPIARDLVDWATAMATEHGPKVTAWANALAEGIKAFVPALLNFVTTELPNWRTSWDDWAAAGWAWITDTAIPAVGTKLGEWATAMYAWIRDNAPAWAEQFGGWATATWGWLADSVIPAVADELGEWWNALVDWATANAPAWGEALVVFAEHAWKWLTDTAIPAVGEKMGEWATALYQWVTDNAPTWAEKLGAWAAATWQWIVDVTPTAVSKLGEWYTAISTWLGDNLPTFITKLGEWATAAWQWIVDAAMQLPAYISDWYISISTSVAQLLPTFLTKLGEWAAAAWQWIVDAAVELPAKLGEWYTAISTWLTSNESVFAQGMRAFGEAGGNAMAQGMVDAALSNPKWVAIMKASMAFVTGGPLAAARELGPLFGGGINTLPDTHPEEPGQRNGPQLFPDINSGNWLDEWFQRVLPLIPHLVPGQPPGVLQPQSFGGSTTTNSFAFAPGAIVIQGSGPVDEESGRRAAIGLEAYLRELGI